MTDFNYSDYRAYQTWDDNLLDAIKWEEYHLNKRINYDSLETKRELSSLIELLDNYSDSNFNILLQDKNDPYRIIILHHWWKLGYLNPLQILRLPMEVFFMK